MLVKVEGRAGDEHRGKDVAADTVVGGVPAKPIKKIDGGTI